MGEMVTKKKSKSAAKKPAKRKARPTAKPKQAAPQNELPALDNDFTFENVPPFSEFKKQDNPELPELDALLKMHEVPASAEQQSSVPPDPAPLLDQPPKKESWLGKMFGKKKVEPVAPSSDSELNKLADELQKGFSEDTQDLPPSNLTDIQKEQMYLENMKRRTDSELRERDQILDDKHEEVSLREKEVDKKERHLIKREFEVVKKEKEYAEIQRLKEQLGDMQVSLEYQKQQVAELKADLAQKDADLRDKEAELDKREADLKKMEVVKQQELQLENENTSLKTQLNEEDDALEYLQQEIERQRKDFEARSMSIKVPQAVSVDALQEVHQLIAESYIDISRGNFASVKQKYMQARDKYAAIKAKDVDGMLYKDLMKLYDDIRRAMK